MATAARRARPKIKPPRKHGPDVDPERIWQDLSHNIREIQNQNAANLSFEENHRFAYNLVLHKHGEMLYKGTMELVVENLQKLARAEIVPAFPTGASNDPMQKSQEAEMLLKALRRIWDEHSSNMVRLGQILKYMDRVYTKSADVPETWDAGLALFLQHIICPPIKDHIITAILQQVEVERDGYVISRSAVKGCVTVLLMLDTGGDSVYAKYLQPEILRESQLFYEREGEKLLETCDASEFLRRAEARFESEESRTHHYLSLDTATPLRQILKDTLLTPHLDTIVKMPNSGLDPMIDLDKIDDLQRMYGLFITVPTGLPCLKRSLKESINRRGKDINASSASDAVDPLDAPKSKPKNAVQALSLALKWVQDVLDLKDRFTLIWKRAFRSDREVEGSIDEAFESFINTNDRCSEYISLFIDDNLRRGLKGKTDNEVDNILDKTITVFRYLTRKDVFERYYKGHLAKRLLLGRSVSDDAERGMLAKLKIECGYQFTQKLEGMFNDLKISADTMEAYKNHLNHTTAPVIDISVIVMTSTFWPMSHSPSPCLLPADMVKATKSFEQFYLARHSGRRLTWQPSLGNADVRVNFKNRKHELNVATFALVILLLFEDLEDDGFLTYEEIKTGTNIEDAELQRHLQSLACAKFKILKKHPPGREVDPKDSFSFNADFTSTLQKIKISTISSKVESNEERKETNDRVDEERRHQIEACIVRIMKDRKHMTHNDLVNEVARQLAERFQPNALSIKKRIEVLIEKEYLERCEDRKSYNYLA
ncbi:Cullin-domain-containing protein [Mycena floridula]|nr:Cullin-domain-containing protein [Mycena floridula]